MFTRTIRMLIIVGLLAIFSGRAVLAATEDRVPPNGYLNDFKVAFLLDPNLTKSIYMGERWVSPPKYVNVQAGKEFVVTAKAMELAPAGEAAAIAAEWLAENPEMVSVVPGENGQVTITIHEQGESTLKVVSAGVSKELVIKAIYGAGTIQAEITQ